MHDRFAAALACAMMLLNRLGLMYKGGMTISYFDQSASVQAIIMPPLHQLSIDSNEANHSIQATHTLGNKG